MTYTTLHLDDVAPLRAGGAGMWHPIRRALGVTALGLNAYSAAGVGDALIERHDERSPGSGGQEEVYLVLRGRAAFTVDGDDVDAPAGTLLLVPAGVERGATAGAVDTLVLVMGGKAGAALPSSPFEYWYAAEPLSAAGQHDEAIAVASEGLADWPRHPMLHYQLACCHALAGHREQAIVHLRIAFDGDPRTREWATDDDDLRSVRDDAALS
jgi:tetratricopeptide (TPR) repeat protein